MEIHVFHVAEYFFHVFHVIWNSCEFCSNIHKCFHAQVYVTYIHNDTYMFHIVKFVISCVCISWSEEEHGVKIIYQKVKRCGGDSISGVILN
jgi:hypothetical protein